LGWQGLVYTPGDSGNDSPVVTNNINRESSSGSDGARGNIRWRHSKNTAGNFLFADGHAQTLRAQATGSAITNGGALLQRNVMVDR